LYDLKAVGGKSQKIGEILNRGHESLAITGVENCDSAHLFHRLGLWHSVRIPFSISGDFKKQYMSGLEVFERFRGFFKTASPQTVAITEVYRSDSLHLLQ